ncbi:SHOCT domain-containing protein [Paenibacillus illinoisensis]|uniref:SHOCT domain-containing protein n=1 Tax=Paenibacillus illinoisensis TaxID=59845 RepID=UPI00301BCEAF
MGIGLLLLIIAVGVTIYVVTRLLMRKYRVEDGPLLILKERYAKGEINDEDFNHKRKLLDD